jgi:arylsulfatase A-like enzyme
MALLLAASGIATAIQLQIGAPGGIGIEAPVGGVAKQYPNVLLFCSDGINARRMSAYGYTRPTTPFIEKLAERSLVFENHFTNSAKTTGSVGSLLSGKLPTTTRVVFRPDVFTGIHIYQHLPGILRRYGFRNGDFSVRHYIDAYDLNMREAFHWANGRSLEEEGMLLPRWFRRSLPSAALFAEESYDRVSGRVLHVLGVREMQNPYVAVARPDAHRDSDRQRVDALKQFIRDSPEPFFAHVHLLGTHGPFFSTGERRFSAGQEQTRAWMPDFYDDAILQYDRFTREIVEFLEERGSFERTILVLNTDHGFRWAIDEPLPLIIHFPGEEHTGVRVANSQRLDIAPTLLEALGIPRLDWMGGQSLLSLQPGRLRPILVTNRMPSVEIGGWRQVPSPSPPFYTLGSLNVILCNFIYRLDLRTGRSLRQQIPNHTAPCMPRQLPRSPEVRAFLVDHLKKSGYDVSSLSR